MKKEPRGLQATFTITKVYHVTCSGNDEDDCWIMAEELASKPMNDTDLVDIDIDVLDGFEYDGF